MDTLYISPGSVAVAVALTAAEMGIDLAYARLNFTQGEQQGPEYLGVNPKGRVPALVTEQGVLTETGAILEYLASQSPGYVPDDPFEAARMRSIMYYLASTVHVNHAHNFRGHRWADDPGARADMKAKVPETMTACAAYLEDIFQGPFLLGDRMTLADPYFFTMLRWFEGDGVVLANFPRLSAFYLMYDARPSVQGLKDLGLM